MESRFLLMLGQSLATLLAIWFADRWWRGWGYVMIGLAWAVFLFFIYVLEVQFPEFWGPCGIFRSDRAWTCR